MMGLREAMNADTDRKKNAPFLELKPFDSPFAV